MAHHPKLSVYIVTLKPRKKEEQKSFRDFLREKYTGDSMTSNGELLQRLFEDFINKVGQDKFNKDDKSKKVIGETMRRGLPHVVWRIGALF